ncbi:MAG: YfhO family protein [Actinomycetes bacterium]
MALMRSPGRKATPLLSARGSGVGLILLLPILAVLGPAIFSGEVMFPAGYFAHYVPWRGVSSLDPTLGNPLLSDIPLALEPWLRFARETIRSGVIPLWNPRVLAGTPFYTNPQSGIFSPFNIPVWVFPFNLGFALASALRLWVAGIGSYLLVRELGGGRAAGLVAGISFSFCSFNVAWLGHGVHVGVVAMLPLALLFLERVVAGKGTRSLIGFAVTVFVAMLGGHPGSQVHVLACLVVYGAVRLALDRQRSSSERVKLAGILFGGLAGGAALAGFLLLPEQLAASGTLGQVARQAGGLPLHVDSLASILFPDWWGRPTGASVKGSLRAVPLVTSLNFSERTIYAGVVPVPLAMIAMARVSRRNSRAPIAAIGALGLILTLGFLLVYKVVGALPLFEHATNSRMTVWFELAVAVLGGLGLQDLLDGKVSPRVVRVVALTLGTVVGAALLATTAMGLHLAGAVNHLLHPHLLASAGALALASLLWTVASLAVCAAGVALVRNGSTRGVRAGCVVLIAMCAVDMSHFASGYQPIGPEAKVVPGVTPAIRFLQRHRFEGRVVGLGTALPNDYATNFGLNDVRGQDAPQPSMSYVRLWHQAGNVTGGFRLDLGPRLSPRGIRTLRVLGTKWVLTDRARQVAGLSLVYSGPDARVFGIPGAIPRVVVPRKVLVTSSVPSAVSHVTAKAFSPRITAVVDRRPARSGAGVARVEDAKNSAVSIRALMQRSGLVVLNEQFAPGWSVSVDGKPARALKVNVVMRGVVVPAGAHRVVWSYRPPGLTAGIVLSVIGFFTVVGLALLERRFRRGPGRRPTGVAGIV